MAEWRKLEGVERELLFDGLEDLGRGVNPVSYTHLDVYKRQLLGDS